MELDLNEADTCREYVTPKLRDAGWNKPYHLAEQRTFTDGRILPAGKRTRRGPQKKADYILRYRSDFAIAVVEAKKYGLPAAQGLQQAMDYAQVLGLKFAYATNGHEIIEHDFITGQQRTIDRYPSPDELWTRWTAGSGVTPQVAEHILQPTPGDQGKQLRYYQEIAVNRAVQAIAQDQRRVLLTMATGTGKTFIAFQICWKLWKSAWNRQGSPRNPRILFLADRNILVDDPKDKTFKEFKDARFKLESGQISQHREMYFAIYQAISDRDGQPGLYRQFDRDFFDLIIIDECHRGSARDESNWRAILEYFEPAYQLGMTATPLRADNRDTYQYFGDPIYEYSLKQGIEDGFLAPYTVHRIVTDLDATGWRPAPGEVDRYQREIPDRDYTTTDFEREIVLTRRTAAIARHLSDFMRKSENRFAKTIVFCVDQEHALDMRNAIHQLNPDLVQQHPDYVCRVTSTEGDVGRGHLDKFMDVETESPVILTTSKLLTTGVDVPTCRNIVIATVINSMTEFKQIIGRGTRVRDDYGKLYFNILDYTGSATKLFADPDFDGYPASVTHEEINDEGETTKREVETDSDPTAPDLDDHELERHKYYVDSADAKVVAEMTYELGADGKTRMTRFTEYAAERVRTLYPNSAEMRKNWADPQKRAALIQQLQGENIDFDRLTGVLEVPDADPFDLLCHIAFQAPIRTRRERADRVRLEETAYFEQYTAKAHEILLTLLEKYVEAGITQFDTGIFRVPPLSQYGNISEIARLFEGSQNMKTALERLQTLLYAA